MTLMIDRRASRASQSGAINGLIIVIVVLIVITLGGIATAGWALYHYYQEKNTVDEQVKDAVAKNTETEEQKTQAQIEAAAKNPNNLFAGPADYGSLNFKYPRTWSVYIAQDGEEGTTYTAYLNPGTVPPAIGTVDTTQFALRVTIQEAAYDTVVNQYQYQVKQGKLTSSAVTINGVTGTRLDGLFNDTIRGSEVIFKLRDKTVTIRTDANTFLPDFNNTILPSIKFNS